MIASAFASIEANATVTAFPVAIYRRQAGIVGTAIVSADGLKFGYNWNTTTAGTETWTNVTTGSETWTEVTAGSNTWLLKG